MVTDDERREAARRLREIRPCKSGYIEWWTIAKALDLKESAGWFGWEKFEPDSVNRLADLIEPSEPKVRCVAEVKVDGEMRHSTKEEQNAYNAMLEKMSVEMHPVDRDALLALADEMEGDARYWLNRPCDQLGSHDVIGYAERIRKAVGVEYGD